MVHLVLALIFYLAGLFYCQFQYDNLLSSAQILYENCVCNKGENFKSYALSFVAVKPKAKCRESFATALIFIVWSLISPIYYLGDLKRRRLPLTNR